MENAPWMYLLWYIKHARDSRLERSYLDMMVRAGLLQLPRYMKKARRKPGFNIWLKYGLLHQNLACFVALTADEDAVFGVGHADALQIVVFNGCILIHGHVFDTGRY